MTTSQLIDDIANYKQECHQKIATHVISLLQSQGISLGDFIRGIADHCHAANTYRDTTILLLEEASQKILNAQSIKNSTGSQGEP